MTSERAGAESALREDEEGLRRDGLCRTCGRACWPLDLTSDHLCVSCCEKERDALLRDAKAAMALNLEMLQTLRDVQNWMISQYTGGGMRSVVTQIIHKAEAQR